MKNESEDKLVWSRGQHSYTRSRHCFIVCSLVANVHWKYSGGGRCQSNHLSGEHATSERKSFTYVNGYQFPWDRFYGAFDLGIKHYRSTTLVNQWNRDALVFCASCQILFEASAWLCLQETAVRHYILRNTVDSVPADYPSSYRESRVKHQHSVKWNNIYGFTCGVHGS